MKTETPPPRIAVITCAVLETEIEHLAAEMPHIVGIFKLPQGLHNEPPKLRRDLQVKIDEVERTTDAQAIVLGYGLCSRGTEGVVARRSRLVLARAHDCITLLLGCRKRYFDYVSRHPGTYWYSPGWNRHHIPPGEERFMILRNEYAEKYGEDNAEFLMETEQNWFQTYDRATYVDLGVGATELDIEYTKACANWLKWDFDQQHGAAELLTDLLAGRWDEERFLVLEPGQTLRMTADESVIEAVGSDDAP